MTTTLLVNGLTVADAEHALAVSDRGLNYGDGLFETARLHGGVVRFLPAHLERLQEGCRRLGIAYPGDTVIGGDIDTAVGLHREGVLKIIVTRGQGARGYRPSVAADPTRIVALHPLPATIGIEVLTVRWCNVRLGRNPALAGVKHLNRLEQVLAQAEWDGIDIGEGLMLDTEGELVCGTASNVFVVRNGTLRTSDLRFCGVRGVMRGQVLRVADELGIPVLEEPLWPVDLEEASEVFVTNAVRGIRSIVALESLRWPSGPMARQLRQALEL
ncbi:MAG TPA: aminodeoxychorismate lyase [Steroidobacteraceae bacterium]|jgi:4-amino-4-deoxychorismate lyase